ncbi:hypothetical protein ScPMuIL_016403 [Solemya velum]
MAAIYERKIAVVALYSRLLILMLQVVFNLLVPDHDAGVFNPPADATSSFSDGIVDVIFSGFRRWDAVYFLHISQFGYTYENCLAFFPLFPLTTKIVSLVLNIGLEGTLNHSNILLISAFLLNQFLFVKTSVILYRLSVIVLKNRTLAYWAAVLFCINPASIFMSAPYSETVYAFVTFQGMLLCEQKKYVLSLLFIGLGTFSRSNGILVVGYIIFPKLMKCLFTVSTMQKQFYMLALAVLNLFWQTFFYTILCLAPFLLYQYYAYLLYCVKTVSLNISENLRHYGYSQGYRVVGGSQSPWCNNTLPLSYSHIQSSHWGVGFLEYYTWQQIPNFLLAVPISVLSITASVTFFRYNLVDLNFIRTFEMGKSEKEEGNEKNSLGYIRPAVCPYVVHMMFLTLFGWLFMHIQVLTRMLTSSCPPIYWFAAHVIARGTSKHSYQKHKRNIDTPPIISYILDWDKLDYKPKLIFIYFLSYMIIGTFAFSNFLPWT